MLLNVNLIVLINFLKAVIILLYENSIQTLSQLIVTFPDDSRASTINILNEIPVQMITKYL